MRAPKGSPDWAIFFTVITLLAIGIVMVFSASSIKADQQFNDAYYFLKRQLLWALIGIPAMLVAMNIDYWHLQKWAKPILFATLILLVLVLVPGIGRVVNGARRWIGVGPIGFNPSEVTKVSLTIFLASFLSRRGARMREFIGGLIPPLLLMGIVCLLILGQPDLGTAVAIAGTVMVMLFAGGARIPHLISLVLAGIPLLAVAIFGEDYRRRRFLAFLNPWADPLGSGYHIIQSLYALGSGGLFGLGLGRSRQKFMYLPEQHTDFIFAILGEEMGFIGAVTVIFLFFLFAWRGYKVAITAPDNFGSLLAVGITTMVTLQAMINIGVVTSTLPITGIPLPFVSFGGSSLVFSLVGVGILLNVSKYSVH